MGRTYFDDAPDVLGQDIQAVRDALAGGMAANEQRQQVAREFIVTHGSDVGMSGHNPVGTYTPDIGADPDPTPDAGDT